MRIPTRPMRWEQTIAMTASERARRWEYLGDEYLSLVMSPYNDHKTEHRAANAAYAYEKAAQWRGDHR